jgi:hypothetical protein
MRVTGKRLLLTAAALVVAVLAFFLFAGDDHSLKLRAQVSGTADTAQAESDGTYRASGTGVADGEFGAVTFTGAGSGAPEGSCVSFSGTGELVTAVGALQLRPDKPGKACLTRSALDENTDAVALQVTVTVLATGTSGSLLGRHGRLKARGTFDPDSGRFTVSLTGRLSH